MIRSHSRSAKSTGFGAKRRDVKLDGARQCIERTLAKNAPEWIVEEMRSGSKQRATENDQAGTKEVRQVRQTPSDMRRRLLKNTEGQTVILGGRLSNDLNTDSSQVATGQIANAGIHAAFHG
jgi:hypothetical protein